MVKQYYWDSQHSMETDPRYVTVPPSGHVDKLRVDYVLDKDHLHDSTTALSNTLRTEVAETTLAQSSMGFTSSMLLSAYVVTDTQVTTRLQRIPSYVLVP